MTVVLKRAMAIRAIIPVFAAMFFVAACTSQFRNHGYVPSDDELTDIVIGVDTGAYIEDIIGTPVLQTSIPDKAFYYVSSRWEYYGLDEPVPIERQIVVIRLDDQDIVTSVEKLTLEDGRIVPLLRRVTENPVKREDTGILKSLFSSAGRISPNDFINNGGGQ